MLTIHNGESEKIHKRLKLLSTADTKEATMLTKSNLFGLLLLLSIITYTESFIVPQEVPSLLSLVYSNIPPIKKGTDSRFGFGYRLGEHADFQVQVELGPQTHTKPIGPASSNSKRAVSSEQVRQVQKETKASSWLDTWLKQTKNPVTEPPRETINRPMISDAAFLQLLQLYGKRDEDAVVGVLPAFQQASPNNKDGHKKLFLNTLNQQQTITNGKSEQEVAKITADLSDIEFDR